MTKKEIIQALNVFIADATEEVIHISYNKDIACNYINVGIRPTLYLLVDGVTKLFYYDNKLRIGKTEFIVPNSLIYSFLLELEEQKILKHDNMKGELIQYDRCENNSSKKYEFSPTKDKRCMMMD